MTIRINLIGSPKPVSPASTAPQKKSAFLRGRHNVIRKNDGNLRLIDPNFVEIMLKRNNGTIDSVVIPGHALNETVAGNDGPLIYLMAKDDLQEGLKTLSYYKKTGPCRSKIMRAGKNAQVSANGLIILPDKIKILLPTNIPLIAIGVVTYVEIWEKSAWEVHLTTLRLHSIEILRKANV